MREPQTLVQAALNRLSARLGSGLADAAAGLAVLAQDAPDRLRQEWDLFKEEVELEAERLEHGEQEVPAAETGMASSSPPLDPQQQIDQLRAQVTRLARRLEEPA
ncbi:hypothetical protein [Synechococcus sp. LTW-R]|jgi:hypothetical protein|uniref:hypothetical protein n=1 Tax=Synechococcus sp. LTW-R TaxID=2751170 RepID=UPI001628762F|nr:hypothetical protein [Synechococcus sp. LTW-R]QNG29307.1 hypothetical protein H0O22_11365 [Synechococcus sp. LTW-R]